MSDDETKQIKVLDEHEGQDTTYKPPPEKSLKEIVEADHEDESLRKYKETLLGEALTKETVIVDGTNPSRVIVKNLALVVAGRADVLLDLQGDLVALKKTTFCVKEGVQYKIRIDFYVQREIVTGLKYIQKISRHGIQVEKITQMVGSYAPKTELQSYITPMEEMPNGMVARGTYTVKSLFTDDDKNEHLKWEWTFELKKEWD